MIQTHRYYTVSNNYTHDIIAYMLCCASTRLPKVPWLLRYTCYNLQDGEKMCGLHQWISYLLPTRILRSGNRYRVTTRSVYRLPIYIYMYIVTDTRTAVTSRRHVNRVVCAPWRRLRGRNPPSAHRGVLARITPLRVTRTVNRNTEQAVHKSVRVRAMCNIA